ncbi:MAG: SIMPL domain-containing protein [Acidimicrobiales bacterium]
MNDENEGSASSETGQGGSSPQPEKNSSQPGTSRRERSPFYVAVAALMAAGVALGGVALGRSGPSSRGNSTNTHLVSASRRAVSPGATITVSGSGSVQGTPDTVSFSIGVQSNAVSANGALSDNNARTAALEASLEAHGVTKADMQTSDLNIWPNYNNGDLTGFSADDTLNVTMHRLSTAGAAIEAGAEAVGNGVQLNGISFSISNQSALLAAARAKAMRSAATQASQLAEGAGLALGGVVRVTDQEGTPSPEFYGASSFTDVAGRAALPVPIQAGRQPVSVQVKVVYLLLGSR